jgi:uncharacterized protein YndB with AHSA1/START domain
MLVPILIGVGALLALLCLIAAFRPDKFRVERSAEIAAPPAKVFALLQDFHEWPKWSPWEKLDPHMTRTHSGAAAGVGAKYAWKGDKKVGEGAMEILEAQAPTRLRIKLDFLVPFEAHNLTLFDLSAAGSGTRITWAMEGSQPFLFRLMCLFMSMDKMVGRDFEKGLAAMKSVAES